MVDLVDEALEVRGLAVRRGPRAVLTGVDFSARAGRVACILGPNGAGKSSLVKAVAGILPYEGCVRIGGLDARTLASTERAKRVAYVPQQSSLEAPLSVASVVALGRYAHHAGRVRASTEDEDIVSKALAMTDTTAFAARPFTRLSQGEKQRVLLARALATGARILLLDEPTSALDVGQALKLYGLLRQLATEGYAVVAVLHPLHEAVAWTDDALLLDRGRVVLAARTDEVIRQGVLERVYGVTLIPRGALGFVLPAGAPS